MRPRARRPGLVSGARAGTACYHGRLFQGSPHMPAAFRCPPLRRIAVLVLVAASLLPPLALAQTPADAGYRTPVPELQAIVDAPRAPQLALGPRRDLAAMWQSPDLPGIDVVAQPELKLAGLRIHPRVHAPSAFSLGADLWLMDVATG